MAWKKSRDPLFRGDDAHSVRLPEAEAKLSVVAHVLNLGGAGRSTPYHSTSESENAAGHFAGSAGHVYRTSARTAEQHGVVHLSQIELKKLLRGKGHGRAKWPSALEVMQARKYVEQWAEHLLDFADIPPNQVADVVQGIYER